MSEKVVKFLRRETKDSRILRGGMRELKRAYYKTSKKERRRFKVSDVVASLKQQEILRRVASAEQISRIIPTIKRRRRRNFWMALPMALMAFAKRGWRR